ncbi:hypothetical protein BamMEX5DRAFT_3458 [Burkholderia ambifaria MEX-5]|uniref:Uncharacterized protein n=1 Tax=Burkholderia ambifaria MEX-5 TaxID=396597 RepID=B1T6P2_9BURK|nr:hypothetical protein BamMEX5DRAFT_3458 [Burkholderia ambifaria MEX-5]
MRRPRDRVGPDPCDACVSPGGHRRKRQQYVKAPNTAKVMEKSPTALRFKDRETFERVAPHERMKAW